VPDANGNDRRRPVLTSRTAEEWKAFRDAADAEWELEMVEEKRLCEEVLPQKPIAFPSPIQYADVLIERNVRVPMRDGVSLAADIYRPKAPGRYPVLISRGPYGRASSLDALPAVMRNLAQRGWVAIAQDVRGRFDSEGEFECLEEKADGHDTVEWAAVQAWSDGQVGLFGISYGAWTSLQAAMGQSPHLKAIFPAMMEYGWTLKRSGIPMLQSLCAWHLWAGYGEVGGNPLRIDLAHLPLVEIDALAGYESENYRALATVDPDVEVPGEMPEAQAAEDLAQIKTNVYYALGWYDLWVDGVIRTWQQIRESNPGARIMIGPYHHNLCEMEYSRIGKLQLPQVELDVYYQELERFFAEHLKGEKNERPGSSAPMMIYVMGRNVWREEYEWPLARTEFRSLYFHSQGNAHSDPSDGALAWDAPTGEQKRDRYDYDPLDPVTWWANQDIWQFLGTMPSREEVEARMDVLTYTTPELTEDLEITGPITAVLHAETDVEDTDFFVTLVDVYPDGHTQYLTQGQVRGRYRHRDLNQPEWLTPGEIVEYRIPLQATSNVFLEGHRLRIEITSSEFNHFARNQNVAEPTGMTANTRVAHQQVLHTRAHPSHIVLPIIPS